LASFVTIRCMMSFARRLQQAATSVQAGPLVLPTGAGIYTYQQTGQRDIQSAYTWVKAQVGSGPGALTFPSGSYPIVPAFTQNSNSCCVLIPAGISTYGQGSNYTFFTLAGALTITGIPTGSGTTNQNYIFRTTGGGSNDITLSGVSIDGSALASSAIPSFQGPYNAATTYALGDLVSNGTPSSVFRSLIGSNQGNTPFGGTGDSDWEFLTFGAFEMHSEPSPTISKVLIKGIYGYANTPPGEIASLAFFRPTGTVSVSDTEIDGGDIGAALIGANSNTTDCSYVFTRVYSHNSGHSMGFALYQCQNATFNQCVATYNGTGLGSSGGIGFNHEECYGTVTHNGSIANVGNSIAASRFEAGENPGISPNASPGNPGSGVDNSNYILNGVTFTGSPYSMKLMGSRGVTDGVINSGSTTLTSATAAFDQYDTGGIITGAGIASGTYMTFVNSTTVTLSQAATASATGVALRINGQQTVPSYDGTSTLSGSASTNSATLTVSPIPAIYVSP
jgi:hypothetical protein